MNRKACSRPRSIFRVLPTNPLKKAIWRRNRRQRPHQANLPGKRSLPVYQKFRLNTRGLLLLTMLKEIFADYNENDESNEDELPKGRLPPGRRSEPSLHPFHNLERRAAAVEDLLVYQKTVCMFSAVYVMA